MNEDTTTQPKKNILCIEDEHFIGELYEHALLKAGFDVKIVSEGDKGLEEALTDSYDIILLDLMVPQVLGTDILHRMRTERPNLKAKVFITTNLEQDEVTRQKLEEEVDGYLIKAEITPNQLADYLSKV